jgi:phage terminase small subunit
MPRGGFRKGAGRKPGSKKKAGVSSATHGARVPVEPKPPVTPIENPHGLSPKELIFVECYTGISKFNASDAYTRAGFKPNRKNAARLMTKEVVERAVAERLGSRLRTLQMDGDEALEGISRIARADIRKVLTPGGHIKPINELDDDTADAIASIKVVERRIPDGEGGFEVEYTKEFKFYDKLDARKVMAKASGKLRDKLDIRVTRGIEDILAEVNQLEAGARS